MDTGNVSVDHSQRMIAFWRQVTRAARADGSGKFTQQGRQALVSEIFIAAYSALFLLKKYIYI